MTIETDPYVPYEGLPNNSCEVPIASLLQIIITIELHSTYLNYDGSPTPIRELCVNLINKSEGIHFSQTHVLLIPIQDNVSV
jgi:hypothetical protein